jgi:hypothetical protein
MIDLLIIFSYFIFAKSMTLRIKNFRLREIIGPFMAAIGLSFLGIGLVEDSFISFIAIFPSCLYLIYISGKKTKREL